MGDTPVPDRGYPQKGPGTRDLGKNLGLGFPWKGPEKRERTGDWSTPQKGPETGYQVKSLGLHPPTPLDRQTDACENITFPSYNVTRAVKMSPDKLIYLIENHKETTEID